MKKEEKKSSSTRKVTTEKDDKKAKTKNVKTNKVKQKVDNAEKQSLWVRFRIFCHGVKSEFDKIHWLGKNDIIKYSLATIYVIIFCSVYFYLIYVVFAFVQSLLK